MPFFLRPPEVSDEGYAANSQVGLLGVYLEPGKSREVLLSQPTDSRGRPFTVRQRDATSPACPVAIYELTAIGQTRRFRLTPVSSGTTFVDVKSDPASKAVDATIQVMVMGPAGIHSGPVMGHDGPIPAGLAPALKSGIEAAWKLNERQNFVEQFRRVVSALSGTDRTPSIYAETLNRMVISLVEGSRDIRLKKGIADEEDDIKAGAVSGEAPSYSVRTERNMWIRTSALKKGLKQITACIFHEATHIAGVRGDPLAEYGLEALHRTAGLPR